MILPLTKPSRRYRVFVLTLVVGPLKLPPGDENGISQQTVVILEDHIKARCFVGLSECSTMEPSITLGSEPGAL